MGAILAKFRVSSFRLYQYFQKFGCVSLIQARKAKPFQLFVVFKLCHL